MKYLHLKLLIVGIIWSTFNSLEAQIDTTSQGQNHKKNCAKSSADKTDCCCIDTITTVCGVKVETFNSILIDFKTKKMSLPKGNFEKGDAFQVKIINYNPFLYKVEIDGTDSSVASPIDAKLLTGFLDPSTLPSLVTNIISKVGPASRPLDSKDHKNIQDAEPSIDNRQLILKMMRLDSSVRKRLTQEQNIREIQGIQRGLIEKYTLEILALRNQINATLYDASKNFNAMQVLYPDCNAFEIKKVADTIERKLKMLLDNVSSQRVNLNLELNRYFVVTSTHRKKISENDEFRFADSLINQSYTLLKQDVAKIDSVFSHDLVRSLISKLEMIAQASSCYVSLPLFMQKDVSKISIRLKPRVDSTYLQPYSTSFFLPWIQKRIWGVGAGVYASALHNETFGIRTNINNANDTTYTILADESGKAEFGANALAYTAWNISEGNPCYLGVSFGAGLSIESKPKPRVFFGMSYVNGERNRLVLSLGVATGFVTRLSSIYATNAEFPQLPVDYVRDRIKASAFLSLSYSFL